MARLEHFPLTEPGVIRGPRPDPRGGVWVVRDTVKVRRDRRQTMDSRTGEIADGKKLAEWFRDDNRKPWIRAMGIPPTQAQLKRRPPRVGRNDPCPCGSGQKFKKCCLNKRTDSKELAELQREAME